MRGPGDLDEDDFSGLLRLAAEEPGPRVIGYWAEQGQEGVARARQLGALGAAGDLFVDGALGSHTACLHEPYADAAHTGTAHLDAAASPPASWRAPRRASRRASTPSGTPR